ncbi:MAG: sulfatase-like hydrolase/transferase [Streptosporangiales bacterium]|nr:sulfatase-like hydrolase/transferase [Streptosporangiales bacterium]
MTRCGEGNEHVGRRIWVIAALLVTALAATACLNQASGSGPRSASGEPTKTPPPPSDKPNIVFVLTDDLSWNLVKYMSEVRRMRANGTTFTNFYAADSLCCPSRSNILTGRYPHNTGVRVNENYRGGGHQAFVRNGNPKRTYTVELDKAGYRAAHTGKYINQYNLRKDPVPPGWDEWHIGDGTAYRNIAGSYRMADVQRRGGPRKITKPSIYLNDQIGKQARTSANRARDKGKPFFTQLWSYAPHHQYNGKGSEPKFPAAERDRPSLGWPGGEFPHGDCGTARDGSRYDCLDLRVRRGSHFEESTYQKLDWHYRDRVQMVQSLNDQMRKMRKQLARNGQLSNTYFVFSSDNGYHLGEHGLMRGKGSAYDHDTRVPLVVTGPGVEKGAVRRELTQTVDLYATFQELAGLKPKPSDGRSLAPLLHGKKATDWRKGVLFEHRAQEQNPVTVKDPDLDGDKASAKRDKFIPAFHSYDAIRTKSWLYVEYSDSKRRELYDLRSDPAQNHNVARKHQRTVQQFSDWLEKYTKCKVDGTSCHEVGRQHPGTKGVQMDKRARPIKSTNRP